MAMPSLLRRRRVRIAGVRTGRASACEQLALLRRRHVPPAPVRGTIARSRPVGNARGVGRPAGTVAALQV